MKYNSKQLAFKTKTTLLKLTHQANASHVGGALSIVDILSVLYAETINFDITDSFSKNRDKVFYSKGHACTVLYSILKEVGFFSEDELFTFTQNGSYFTSHINHKIKGVELSTGSLGHALSVSCGVALAHKIKQENNKVYTIVSDGELNEGSNWEAILFAPHHKLSNLTLIVDYNKIQSLGRTNEVLNLEPLAQKFNAFGWFVMEIDGHNHKAIKDCFINKENDNKPKVIIAHTIKGKGVDFMEDTLEWHYKSPNAEQLKMALSQINEEL